MPEHIDEESGEVTVAGTIPRAIIAVGMPLAVALTAGVAALRLVHLGRDALVTSLSILLARSSLMTCPTLCVLTPLRYVGSARAGRPGP